MTKSYRVELALTSTVIIEAACKKEAMGKARALAGHQVITDGECIVEGRQDVHVEQGMPVIGVTRVEEYRED